MNFELSIWATIEESDEEIQLVRISKPTFIPSIGTIVQAGERTIDDMVWAWEWKVYRVQYMYFHIDKSKSKDYFGVEGIVNIFVEPDTDDEKAEFYRLLEEQK